MSDRETVKKGLRDLRRYLEDREWSDNREDRQAATDYWQAVTDALALLKEQDAVEPYSHLTEDFDLYFTCGKCGHVIWSESYKHCPMCGLKIAWNGEGR